MATLVCSLLQLYLLVLIVRVVLSWFPISPDGSAATVAGFLYLVTDPVLGPLRRVLPPLRMGAMALDLSPIVAFFGISILMGLLCSGPGQLLAGEVPEGAGGGAVVWGNGPGHLARARRRPYRYEDAGLRPR